MKFHHSQNLKIRQKRAHKWFCDKAKPEENQESEEEPESPSVGFPNLEATSKTSTLFHN